MEATAKHLTRQLDLIPIDVLGKSITIIGAGAVGSWVALALAKMGFLNLTVMDPDVIDEENMNCQFYPIDAIGEPKALALHRMIQQFTGFEINVYPGAWEPGKHLNTEYVIAAVDSMEVRRDLFNACGPATQAFIDPRMGAEVMQMYCLDPNKEEDKAAYIKSWYSSEDAKHEKCTAKSTIYCANLLAGLVCKTVKNLAVGQPRTRVLTWNLNPLPGKDSGYQSWGVE